MAPAWAVPVPSFTYSPTQPLTGQTITFTSTSTGATIITWDLDGDGYCDDASGSTATASFASSGQLHGDGLRHRRRRPAPGYADARPSPSATVHPPPHSPSSPTTRSPARAWCSPRPRSIPTGRSSRSSGTSTGTVPSTTTPGEAALKSWPKAGTYPVALRVTDRDGAAAVARVSVVVGKKPPKQFTRTPLVRLISSPTSTGAHLDLLTVSASARREGRRPLPRRRLSLQARAARRRRARQSASASCAAASRPGRSSRSASPKTGTSASSRGSKFTPAAAPPAWTAA